MSVASKIFVKPADNPDKKPAKNLGGWRRVILFTFIIFIVSQFLAVYLSAIIFGLINPHTKISLYDSIAGQFSVILMAELLSACAVIYLVRRRRLNLSVIGFGRRPMAMDAVKAVMGFVAFFIFLIISNLIVNALWPDLSGQKQDLGFTDINTGTDNVLAFISLVILPPLGEETLFRGYLYSGLRKVWRFWPALLFTSLLFGVAHLEFGTGGPLVVEAAIDTFLLSVVLVFLRQNTGALYASIAVHMLNNLIAFTNIHH